MAISPHHYSLWRVKAGFHTLPQVFVGAAVGTVDAVLWYRFCQAYFLSQVRLASAIVSAVRRQVDGKYRYGIDWYENRENRRHLLTSHVHCATLSHFEVLRSMSLPLCPITRSPCVVSPFRWSTLKVEAFFGGTDVPVELAIAVCFITFFTFGNAQRKISKILAGGNKDD